MEVLYTLFKSGLQRLGCEYASGLAFICVNPAGLSRAGRSRRLKIPFRRYFILTQLSLTPIVSQLKKGSDNRGIWKKNKRK